MDLQTAAPQCACETDKRRTPTDGQEEELKDKGRTTGEENLRT